MRKLVVEDRRVYLLRPGKLELPDERRRYIGQLDIPLNEEGIQQTYMMRKRLEFVEFGSIYCSDLSRSLQTAEIIAAPRKITVNPLKELREIHLGKWEGKTIAEVAKKYPVAFKERGMDLIRYRVPSGESYVDCSRRVVTTFHEILHRTSGNILISGHIDVNRLLLCYILGLPVKNLFRVGQKHGCINIIECSNLGFKVDLVNFTGKISDSSSNSS